MCAKQELRALSPTSSQAYIYAPIPKEDSTYVFSFKELEYLSVSESPPLSPPKLAPRWQHRIVRGSQSPKANGRQEEKLKEDILG